MFLVILCILSGVTSFTIGASENDAATPNDIATGLSGYPHALAAPNTISFPTDEFSGAYDTDGIHQVSTTDFGNITFKITDDGTGTAFGSLTPIAGSLNRGFAHGSAITGIPSADGLGYTSNAGNGQNGIWFVFASDDGGEFNFTGFDIRETLGVFNRVEVHGFRNGIEVVSEEVSFTASTNNTGRTLTDTGFQNVDEIRIRQKTTGFYNAGTPGSESMVYDNLILDTAIVPNRAPTASGVPFDLTVVEDTASNTDLSSVTFADADGDSLTVTLTATAGTFVATTGGGVTVGGSDTGTLTLAGTVANINTYLDTASNVQYTGAANANGNDAAMFTIQANDGTVNPTLGTVNLDITAVNDAPTASGIPSDITVVEDTASNIDLSAVTFADLDGNSLTVTLTATAGTFAATTGGGVTIGGSGTGTLTLVGTAANINTYLDTASNVQYTSATNANGNDAATFTIQANDGTVNPTLSTVNLDITAVNDAPTASGIPSDITVVEDTASNIDLSSVTFADIDGNSLTVTLTTTAGTFAATTGGGVTAGVGPFTSTLTLAGTAANINTYLDTPSNVQYTGAANANGNDAATFVIQANDGTVNPTLGTVNLDITAVNDVPTASGIPSDVTVIEDTASNVDLSAVTFADVDGGSLTVTLTATAGTWAATTGGGVTVGGSDTGALTLAGTAANINTYLDTASNVQYTGAANASGNDAATFTIQANDGTVNPTLGTVNLDIIAVNDAPSFSNLDGIPTFIEGGTAQILDSNVSITDAELDLLNGGNGDYNGALLLLMRNGGFDANDTFSIFTGGNLIVAGSNIFAGGNIFAIFDTASNGRLTISFTSANGTTPTTALVNEVMQAIRYANSNNDPAVSVQISWTLSDGNSDNAQGTGDNPGIARGSTTISVTNVNDAPTLIGFGGNPTYTENAGAWDLFNTVNASTIETADRFTTLRLTVTNVRDGGAEILGLDGSDVALINGNAVITVTNSLSVSVSMNATTATVSFTGATLTSAQMQTLVDGMTYRNSSEAPYTAANRVTTITSISDDGGMANGGSDTSAPNLTSTVTVNAVNDAPTLVDWGPDLGHVSYVAGTNTFAAFDSGVAANVIDPELDARDAGNGNYHGATIALQRNGGAHATDRFGLAGGTTALDTGSVLNVGGINIGTVTAGSATSGFISITLNNNASSVLVDQFFQTIGYINTDAGVMGTVTIDITLNDGNNGVQGSGGPLGVTQPINVSIGSPPTIENLNGDQANFIEEAGAILIDQGSDAVVTDPDSTGNLNGGNLWIAVTDQANATEDILSFSLVGGFVTMSDTTAGSLVSVDTDGNGDAFVVIGTLANNITAGNVLQVDLNSNASIADVQVLLRRASYNNNSDTPDTDNRTISFVLTDGSNLASDAVSAMVSFTPVNDIPVVSNLPSDIIVIINSQSQIDFSGVSFDDVDSAVITVTLTASAGVFAVPGDGVANGVTATLVNATTIMLAGSPADINAYLDTIANIQYTSAVSVSGENAATILVDANDGDGSGNINLGTVNVDVAYDFTVAAQQSLFGSEVITCPQNKTLVLDGSATGFDYYLRENNNFAVIEGPISGTGSSLKFETGVVNQTTSYEAFAANPSFALAFDGVASDVVIPHSSDFDFSDGLTIEVWINATDIAVGNQTIFGKENNGADQILLGFQDNGTVLSFGIETSVDGFTELDAPIDPADFNGQWVHVVATFDAASNAMRLYRNGVEIGNKPSNGLMQAASNPTNVQLGSHAGVSEFFGGRMAALRVWNTAPSNQAQVDLLLSQGLANLFTGTEPGLVAYYAFFAGAGSVLNDASNDNSGDISGAQWINGISGGVGTVVSNTVQLSCVVYVDLNATGADDGSSWADAFDTIQEGVDASNSDGLIRVAEGNYMITDEVMIDQPLNIRGGFPTGGGTQDIENHPTTLDAFEPIITDRQRVLSAQHTSGALYLEGLTIINGLNAVDGQGGGIFTSGDLRLNQVNISDNSAGISGGGIHSESGDITLIHSTVSNNVVDGSFGSGTGGGIYSNSGSITLINTTISNNEITASDFAIGGGVFSNSGQIWAVNSQINNNLTSTTTTFSEGGGLITNLGSIHLINSAVINNQIASFGSFQGGGIVGDVSLENSMLWGNEESFDGVNFTPSEFQSNALTTNHSLIKGLNLTADDGLDASDPGFDPLFTDEMNADFSPQSGSPLLDAGDVNLLPADAFDVDGDADITERIPLDLAGMSRASGTEVDIGPFEYQTEYLVGGQLTGLLPGNSIAIQNNGNDDLVLTGDGAFVFGTPVVVGGGYVVTVLTQPNDPIQSCTVQNQAGSIVDQDITDVVVACEAGDDLIFRDGFDLE